MILVLITEVNGRHFRTESCQWISIQNVAPIYPKCAISQTTQNQRSISIERQYKAKQDLIQISKKTSYHSFII